MFQKMNKLKMRFIFYLCNGVNYLCSKYTEGFLDVFVVVYLPFIFQECSNQHIKKIIEL